MSKNTSFLVRFLIINVIISALVGSVFGYYGATFFSSTIPNVLSIVSGKSPTKPALTPVNESATVQNIVAQYSPAVVSIVASKDLPVFEQNYVNPFQDFCNDPFFRQFFGSCDTQVPQYQQKGTQKQDVSAGTGFIVRSDGLILTNKHVVDVSGADYTVILSDGKKYPAKVLATDPLQDLAVVKIEAVNLPTVKLGDSDNLQVGETVIAIGNALGQFSNTVSKGIVSGLSRSITASEGSSSEKLEKVIQTDAAINPGNSGGPLINLNGEVVGVNTAIVSGAQNVGFALPINTAKTDIQDVELTGKIVYPYLGVRYVLVDQDVKAKYGLAVDNGAFITKGPNGEPAIASGSPAEKAGIKEGDVIVEADGKQINSDYTLAEAIQTKKVGEVVSLKIQRGSSTLTIQATLGQNQ